MEKCSLSSQESTNCADKCLGINDKHGKNKTGSRASSPIMPKPTSSTARHKIVPVSGKPYFTFIIRKSHVKSPFKLIIPRSFYPFLPSALARGVLSYQNKNWDVTYSGESSPRYFYDGWRKFALDNNLKVGDACVLEVMDTVNLKFQVQILSGEIPPEAIDSGTNPESPIMVV